MWRGDVRPAALLISCMLISGFYFSLRETTLADYRQLFKDPNFSDSLFLSFYVASTSTILSLLLGLLFARVAAKHMFRGHALAVPLFVPHIGAAYLALLYLSDVPIIAPHEASHVSLILTYVYKELPFIFFYLTPVYTRIDRHYLELAGMFGLPRHKRLWLGEGIFLFVPVLEVALIVFAFILFSYEVPALLGVTQPKMLGVYAYELYTTGDLSSQPVALASTVVVTFFFLFIVAGFAWILRPFRLRLTRGIGR
ncbi:ABC transporter permease family protein [Exiguobacterium flavidum]|uniref:ABC transporter permease n=1 Tax=Exiguobacterium flavidum TaxID=2184695 RepID=UPI000DF738AD|nr:ABC transporter permease [Exiguobacterium flavidum]